MIKKEVLKGTVPILFDVSTKKRGVHAFAEELAVTRLVEVGRGNGLVMQREQEQWLEVCLDIVV